MFKFLVVLAAAGTMSAPAFAQAQNPSQPQAQQQAQPAKPQMVKKRVCEQIDENPYSRLGSRKICKTVMVPANEIGGGQSNPQASTAAEPSGR